MSIFGDLANYIRGKSHSGFIVGGLDADGTKWNGKDYLKAADISLYTDRAITKRMEKVGEIEWLVKDDKSGDTIDDHEILRLLRQPNEHFDGFKFWSMWQGYYDYIGETYIVVEMGEREIFEPKNIQALHMLNPTKVTTKWNPDGSVAMYEYQTRTGKLEFLPTQVLRNVNPDLQNPMKGRSLIKSGVQSIQTEIQIGAYHARVLENGGKVEGVFKFKTPRLQQQQLKQLKDDYEKEYADARKSGMPLFLGGDSEYQRTGLSPDELSFLEAKKTTLEDIVIMTGVPKSLLGSVDDVQYSNAETSHRIFLRETIKPLLRNLSGGLDKVLLGEGVTLTFVDPTPQNVEEQMKLIESGIKNYLITPNEGRRMLAELTGEELPDLADGNNVLVPFNMIPLGDASVVSREGDSGSDEGEKSKKKDNDGEVEHPLRDPEIRKTYGRMMIKRMDNREKPFKRALNTYFKAQRDRLIERLNPDKARVFRKEGLLDENFSVDVEVSLGQEQFIPLVREMVTAAGVEAMELVGSEGDFVVGADIVTWMEQRTETFMRSVNETTYAKLTEQFAESLAEGESRKELIKRIEKTYDGISKARAATIARTEVHNSTQFGTMEGYRQSATPIKIWVSSGDLHVRDSHARLDGQERPLGSTFSNGLMYPGDPSGTAEEVINCRCTI
jgi:HK97 family phage portal protein